LHSCTFRGAWIEIYIVQVKLARPAPTPQKGKPGRGFLYTAIKPGENRSSTASVLPQKRKMAQYIR